MPLKYKDALELLAELRGQGYEKEVPAKIIRQEIARKTGTTAGWVITRILKDLHGLGLIRPGGPGIIELLYTPPQPPEEPPRETPPA